MKYLLLLFIFLFPFLEGKSQSPWVASEKGYYFQFAYNTIPEYNSLFNGKEEAFQTSRYIQDKTIQLYGEYGITENITIIASIPYKLLRSGELNPNAEFTVHDIPLAATVHALGNVQISLKHKLLDKKWVASGQLRIELPAAVSSGIESGLMPGYDAFSFAPIASIGRGWNKFYGYYWLSGIIRTNSYSEYLNTGIEGGWKPIKGFWFIVYSELLHSFKNGSRELPPPEKQFGLYSNDLEYFSFGLKLLYEIDLKSNDKIGFFAHAAGSFSGFAVAHSPLLSLGIYLKK
ncbi:MAG: hypothetical protein K8R74_03065 [Bacteroidales bacterium]|nr:hypothetical protein [Bacteroidales bacterium]